MVTCEFTVSLETVQQGGFLVKCLEIPVVSQGETREEALCKIREAILGYLDAAACTRIPQDKESSLNN